MKTSKDYRSGEAVEVAPQYMGSGRYTGTSTTAMYVCGPCGEDDLKLSFRRGHDYNLIVHLQAIVGSGRCFWETEQGGK